MEKAHIGADGVVYGSEEEAIKAEESLARERAAAVLQAKDEFEQHAISVADYATDGDLDTAVQNRVLEILEEEDNIDYAQDDDLEIE